MAYSDNLSRLSRLTSILLKLRSKSIVSADYLAREFTVSKRTIYRDLIALEQAGLPLVHYEGRGYGIIEGYHMPPIMFSEAEAHAILFGEKLIDKTKDQSLISSFKSATDKIKSVLNAHDKEKVELLSRRTIIGKNWQNETTSNHLSKIQHALTHFKVLEIVYRKEATGKTSRRMVEPFAIYHNTSENWVLIAWCRLRNDFRTFRLDRIEQLTTQNESFSPHSITLAEYVEMQRIKYDKNNL